MVLIPDSLQTHFVRWAKIEYDSIPQLGIDVKIMLFENDMIGFDDLKEYISLVDAEWEDSWDFYRKYNRV